MNTKKAHEARASLGEKMLKIYKVSPGCPKRRHYLRKTVVKNHNKSTFFAIFFFYKIIYVNYTSLKPLSVFLNHSIYLIDLVSNNPKCRLSLHSRSTCLSRAKFEIFIFLSFFLSFLPILTQSRKRHPGAYMGALNIIN